MSDGTKYAAQIQWNVKFHNENKLFYTLSPTSFIAIEHCFRYLHQHSPHLLQTGAYYEFGVFKGFTLWFAQMISKHFVSKDFLYY